MARRIGIGFDWQGNFDRERAFERARAADDAGVDSLWVAEAWGRDAFSLLTQLAERTTRAKLGTSIVNIYSRTPAALAQHFATLDELSGGRVIIGLGNSGPNVIEHFHGVPFQPALRRMRETVELLRLFFRHEPVKYSGELFKLERGFSLRFDPVRKEVPIYLATLNPKSVRMTAELADGWLPVMIPIDQLGAEISRVHGWIREAGRDPKQFTVRAPGGVTVANTAAQRELALRRSSGTLAFYCARMGDFYYRQLSRQGFQAEADLVRTAWAEGGPEKAAASVPQAMMARLGFIGSTEECCERLAQEAAAGATLHSAIVLEEDPREAAKILAKLVG
jgi:F420-dependent oxidoreductase-like protein